jgi:hypothetical protein
MTSKGVLVATDQTLEWMLPWWVYHYKKHCDLPIAFVDLGMSEEKKALCKEHGTLISIESKEFHFEPSKLEKLADGGEFNLSSLKSTLSRRNAWFLKPSACLASPFEKTLWIDVDCEILKPIDILFSRDRFACSKESESVLQSNISRGTIPKIANFYNSGLIYYEKNHHILLAWAKELEENPGSYYGDQAALSVIIQKLGYTIDTFPIEHHRFYNEEIFESTVIRHYCGIDGKKEIILKMFFSL